MPNYGDFSFMSDDSKVIMEPTWKVITKEELELVYETIFDFFEKNHNKFNYANFD